MVKQGAFKELRSQVRSLNKFKLKTFLKSKDREFKVQLTKVGVSLDTTVTASVKLKE
jgi:hypothetical protein